MSANNSPKADRTEFNNELSSNPLGDRDRLKAVGPYIIEQYRNPIGTRRRRRNGEPEQGVISVWEKVPEGEDHFRGYRDLLTRWTESKEAAVAEYGELDSPETVAEYVEEHADDDDE